jgi:putative hydrolase of the HAD superfamily
MVIDAVVFDVGRVVLDFDFAPLLAKVAPLTPRPVDEVAQWFRSTALQEAFETGRIPVDEFIREVKTALALSMTDDDFVAAWNSIFTKTKGMEPLLAELAPRTRLFAATNTNALHLAHIRAHHHVLSYFEHIVASCEIGRRKPDAAFYDEVVSRAALAPESLLFVDDLEANVTGAKAAGLQAIRFEGAGSLRERLVTLEILPPE